MNKKLAYIGLLSRSCLLVVIWSTIAIWAFTFLLGIPDSEDIREEVVVPDVLSRLDKGLVARGLVTVGDWSGSACPGSYGLEDGRQLFINAKRRMFGMKVADARLGTNRLLVRGLPHGPVAFQATAVWLVTVSADREVYLVDTKLADTQPTPKRNALRRCLDNMERRGEVALFFAGGLEGFVEARRVFRKIKPELPLLYEFDKRADSLYLLLRTETRLGRGSKDRIRVITGDVEFARAAAERRFAVHLIAPRDKGDALAASIKRYASFEELSRSLAAE